MRVKFNCKTSVYKVQLKSIGRYLKLRVIILIIIVLTLALRTTEAQSVNFLFSENVSGGTITGEIVGLTANATSTPTNILIFSQPAGYADSTGGGPLDLGALGYGYGTTDNTFTVNSSGQIIAADAGIYRNVAGGYQGYAFNVTSASLGLSNANGVFEANSLGQFTQTNANTGGFGGVTYTPVPEPRQTMAIFLLIAIVLFAVRKFRKQIVL